MSETTSLTAIKEYLRNGTVPESFDVTDVSLNQLQSLILRRYARQAETEDNHDQATYFRGKSQEILQRVSQSLDYEVVEHVLNAENVDYAGVIDFLKERGVKKLPVLSTTPPEIIDQLKGSFDLIVVPTDQAGYTDFEKVLNSSEVPSWYREARTREQESQGKVNILKALGERWFLLLTVFLGIIAAAGFTFDWGIEIENIVLTFDLYFSIYGAIAIGRSAEQIRRAEKWNSYARSTNRPAYAEELRAMMSQDLHRDTAQDLSQMAQELAKENISWDEFCDRFGLTSQSEDKQTQPSILDYYVDSVSHRSNGKTAPSKEEVATKLGHRVIEKHLGEKPPTVAVVIPTYQTSLEEMTDLLRSIKDQVYPVTTAYVVYNDDPNDKRAAHGNKKQAEFLEFQKLVTQINAEPGRNNCRIHLLAQPARGKREAMAMGFAMGLGKTYHKQVQEKYKDVDDAELRSVIANIDLADLPDESHDYILNIDSDTRIHDPFAVLNSALLMADRPEAATTTGDVRVVNRHINLLSEMTFQRYWRAFFVERAAQAPEVTCMSGPWVFMRGDALGKVLTEWYEQEFLGQRTTYGDDRHLSTLFLKYGYESLFCPDSAVETDCPTDWETFIKQQLRWNKSFVRENYILWNFLHQMDKFVQLDVVYQQSFAFAMLYILANITAKAVEIGVEQGPMEGLAAILPYGLTVLLYNELFFGLYGALKNKDPQFFKSPVYIYYHFRSLIWLKVKAYVTQTNTSWGTKGESAAEDLVDSFFKDKNTLIDEILEEAMAMVARGEVALDQEPIGSRKNTQDPEYNESDE